MTFEEAKKIFLNRGYIEVSGGMYYDADKWRESITVISNWLEQEPCEDAVSRKIDEFELKGKTAEVWIVKGKLQIRCLGVIHNIPFPSVTPKEKTGKWIPVSEGLPETVNWYLTSIKWNDGTERVTISWFDGESFKAEVKAWMPLPEHYKGGE